MYWPSNSISYKKPLSLRSGYTSPRNSSHRGTITRLARATLQVLISNHQKSSRLLSFEYSAYLSPPTLQTASIKATYPTIHPQPNTGSMVFFDSSVRQDWTKTNKITTLVPYFGEGCEEARANSSSDSTKQTQVFITRSSCWCGPPRGAYGLP